MMAIGDFHDSVDTGNLAPNRYHRPGDREGIFAKPGIGGAGGCDEGLHSEEQRGIMGDAA